MSHKTSHHAQTHEKVLTGDDVVNGYLDTGWVHETAVHHRYDVSQFHCALLLQPFVDCHLDMPSHQPQVVSSEDMFIAQVIFTNLDFGTMADDHVGKQLSASR